MGLAINTNVASINAQSNLARTSGMLSKSLERLSSGLKINRGADGPAALVISEQQRAQIAGLRSAIGNTGKAVAMVQTAEGALNEINSLLVKIRGLALDSANTGVHDSTSLAANQAEVANALSTIDRIAANTQFGAGKKLLDGSAGLNGTASDTDVTFLRATADTTAGTGYAVSITTAATKANVTAGTAQTANLAAAETLTINGVQVTLAAGSDQSTVVARINQFSGQTGVTADVSGGALRLIHGQYGTSSTVSAVSNVAAAADSSGVGTTTLSNTGVAVAGTIGGNAATGVGNVLTGTAGATKGVSLSFAAATATATVTGAQGTVSVTDNSLVFQIGANAGQTAKVGIDKMATGSLGLGLVGVQFGNLSSVNVSSASAAQDTIKVVDQAVADVSALRGRLGAFQQHTLESTENNLRTMLENTSSAESVIRDTDFAVETSNFSKAQVLMQVGTTVLQNANQSSQLILSLFR